MDLPEILAGCVNIAVDRVFSTMVSLKTEQVKVIDIATLPHDTLEEVTGSVSFTGAMTGILYLSINPKLTQEITARILGDDGSGAQEQNDVIGELTNMVTGTLKTAMADKGYNSTLSIPTVIRGQSITMSCRGFLTAIGMTYHIPELNETFHVRALCKID